MKKLSFLDLIFFLVETEDSPKHVAGLMLFKKPTGCSASYTRELTEELKTHDKLVEPFNLVINFVGLKGPHWEYSDEVRMDEHIFYHRPKRTMSWQAAQDFAARLHEPLMDRSKPLWEFHLIDGIAGRRFAVYIKLHHAYADGMTMTSWLEKSYRDSPDDLRLRPIWSMKKPRKKRTRKPSSSIISTAGKLIGQARDQLLVTSGITKLATQQSLERLGITRNAVALQFNTPGDTPMTGHASPGRYLATGSVSMSRVKDLCAATRSTLNHVALSCIDGAMHRYLAESALPVDHHVTIQMPVSLRSEDDSHDGNKLGIVLVDLAHPTEDILERHQEIGYSLRSVKEQLKTAPGTSFEQYTILVAGLSDLIEKLKLSDTIPTNGHTVVSNVPGPKIPLFMKGSKMEHMYPISTLAPGLRMNITLFSYAGTLHFGVVATQDMKELQKLADYIGDEFQKFEDAIFF